MAKEIFSFEEAAAPASTAATKPVTFSFEEAAAPAAKPAAAATFSFEEAAGSSPSKAASNNGMLEAGNIDLANRPRVKNSDGSISTVRSMGVNIGGKEVLIPTVSDDGRIMTDDEAVQAYRRTGRHLGMFSTPEAATRYAEQLHNDQAKLIQTPTEQPAGVTDPSGADFGQQIMTAASPRRESVLEGVQMSEPKFDPAEAQRLSRRDYAESHPVPGADGRSGAVMRPGGETKPADPMFERGAAIRDASLPVRAAFKAVSGVAKGAGGVLRSAGDLTGIPQLTAAGQATSAGAEKFEQGMGDAGPVAGFGPKSPVPYLGNMAEGATSSLGQSAMMASSFGPKAVIPLLSVMTAGQEYERGRNAGLDPAMALAGAIPKGTFEAIGEKFTGLDKVAGAMGTLLTRGASEQAKHTAADVLVRAGIREVPGEIITYLGQTATDLLPGIGLNPDLTMGQFLNGLRDTTVQAAMMGGAFGSGGAVARTDPRIKRLRDAGEKEAADLLQKRQDQLNLQANVISELSGMQSEQTRSPEFQAGYIGLRADGTKPVEAAGRSALNAGFRQTATAAGMSEKAIAAALEASRKIGLDKLPGFLQRYTQGLASRGAIQAPDAALGTLLEAARDDAMDSATQSLYGDTSQTMDDAQTLESGQNQRPAVDNTAPQAINSVAPTDSVQAVDNIERILGQQTTRPDIDQAAHAAATSPLNDLPEPTQAQKEAGNYQKGHINLHGLDIAIENPQGSERRGVSPDGTEWSSTLASHYGYFKRTNGNDGDHVDTFIGPNPDSTKVFVVDQLNKDGSFDEHKVMLGFDSLEEADRGYHANYEPGWTGRGAITEVPLPAFKSWVRDGKKKEPISAIQFKTQEAGQGQGAAGTVTPETPDTAANAGNGVEGSAARAVQPAAAADLQPVADQHPAVELSGKTPAQLAAMERAAQRLRLPNTGSGPLSAHAFIAAEGGLSRAAMADTGFDANVRVGNRWLFVAHGKGLTLEQAAMKLAQAGYLPAENESDAADLIRRSMTQPQYTAEGWQALAEAEHATRYEDHLAVQQEADTGADPLAPDGFTDAELEQSGYDDASPEVQAEVRALLATAEDQGIDAETVLENVAKTTENATQQAYYETAKRALETAIAAQPGSEGDQRPPAGSESPAPGQEQDPGQVGQEPQQTPADAGVSVSGFTVEPRADGTLAVKGDAKAIREALNAIPAKLLVTMKGGILVGRTQAEKAQAILRGEQPKPTAREAAEAGERARQAEKKARQQAARAESTTAPAGLSIGIMPSTAEAVTVRNGIVFIGDNEAIGYDSGEPVTVAAGASDQQIVDALKEAGALSRRQRVFGLAKADSEGLTAPTREDVIAQQERADTAETRDQREQVRRESEAGAGQFSLTQEDGRQDTTGSLFDQPAAQAPKAAARSRAAAPAEITDFGEKLPPARRAMAAKLDESLSDEKIATLPFSQVWPAAENDAIEDTFAAAVAHTARAEVPAKPRVSYKIKRWVDKVKTVRNLASMIVSGKVTRDEFIKRSGEYALKNFIAKVKLLEQLDRADWKRIGAVSEAPDAFQYGKDGTRMAKPMVSVTIDGKHQWIEGSGDILQHVEAIKSMLVKDAPESRMQFEIRQESRGDRKVFINKKGDKEYRRLMEFTTVEEARAALKDQYADLVAAWEGVKDRDNISERDLRTAENRPRTGKDHRGGKDVTAEEFQQQFGFRGGEFGKWVSQGSGAQERQFMLNSAYDALMDLSDLLGIPAKAISLEGSLGLAFGSRGGGWASAHFEPSNLVINLTKPRGAGALAHEWFHAMDNYFARKRGGEVAFTGNQDQYRRDNYVTYKTTPMMVRKDGRGTPVTKERLTEWRKDNPGQGYLTADQWIEDPKHKPGVRAEVEQRFDDLVKALNASPMLQRSRTLDGVKEAEGYWSSVIERAARSFENYVQTRMMEQGYHNDFLANVKTAVDVGKNAKRYPYLLPDEVAPIAEAFDNLFQTIETKDTDKGVAMFARGGTPAILSVDDATAELVQEYGEPVASKMDAERRMSAGERLFGMHEQDETLSEFTSVKQLDGWTSDQLIALPADAAMARGSDQTGTPEFKRWFGDSKVVDAEGKPLVMYHGTNKTEQGEAFTMFDTYASNYGLMGQGGYFTTNPEVASSYTTKGRGDAPSVYPAYLSIKNPLDMDAKANAEAWTRQFPDADNFHEDGDTNESWYRAAEESIRDQEVPMYEGAQIMQEGLRAMGFDGITHMGGGRVNADSTRHRVYVAFDPEQIKSATGNNGQFDASNANITLARGMDADAFRRAFSPPQAMSVAGAQKIIDELTTTWENGPKFKAVATAKELPIAAPRDTRGWVSEKGTAFIVASNHVSRDAIAQTLAHEAIGHYGLWKILGKDGKAKFERNLQMALKTGNKPLAKIRDKVRRLYVDDTGKFNLSPEEEANEIAAFAVEEAVDPVTGEFTTGMSWLKQFWAQIADFLRGLGLPVKFTKAELHGLLVASMKGLQAGHRLDGGAEVLVAAARDASTEGKALQALGENDDLFALPRSDKTTVEGIAADNDPGIKVEKSKSIAETLYTLTMPDGKTALIWVRPANPYGERAYSMELNDGEVNNLTVGRPGENPEAVDPSVEDVYLDVSGLKPGSGGNVAYNIAATFAHNTGRIFIGDPTGLSNVAMRRRLENMISSALKFGTTDHLAPHPRQVRGDAKLGIPALRWVYGDSLGNIRRMIDASLKADENSGNEALVFSLRDGLFSTGRVGATAPVHQRGVSDLGANLPVTDVAGDARPRSEQGRAGVSGPSGNLVKTRKRAAVFRALLRESGESGSPAQRGRDELLAGLLRVARQHGDSVNGIFYARGKEQPAAGSLTAGALARGNAATGGAIQSPLKSSQWRDTTGRTVFAPGQALYNLIGKAANPLLVKLQLKAASLELRHQLRQMKLDVQKAQDVAVAVAKESQKLSSAERLMVSDIIEKELAAGTVPPEHAVRLAAAMNTAMSEQSKELIRLGMLTPETAAQWDGRYLPRFYESKLRKQVGEAWADAARLIGLRPKSLKGIGGKHLKGRGLFETIPENQLANYEAMGWQVRDPDYTPSLPSVDGTVQVWRDFTRQERDAMGEIRDAGFRFVMGYMQTQRDIALGRMFEGMAANPETSSRLPREGWVRVPDTTVEGTGAKRYGKLAGRYVPMETLSQLTNIEEAQSAVWRMYRSAMAIWKEGKTALNPVSHVNNVLSNLTMAHFAGIGYHRFDKYLGAMQDFVKAAPMVKEARDAGLFLGTMSDAELMNTLPPELKELAVKADSKTKKGATAVYNAMTFWLRKPMGTAYQAEDTFFRYLIYRDARQRGTDPQDAVDYAQKYIFTYDDLPKGARMVRDFGIPFFAYTYKAVPALLNTALTRPDRFLAPAAVLWAANAAAYAIAAGDDDDSWKESLTKYLTDPEFRAKAREAEKLEREFLPPWMKGTTALFTPRAIRLGMDELTKLPVFIDTSRIIPGGDLFDVSPNAMGLPIPQPVTPSHPLFTTAVAMIGNKDLFFGKEIIDSNDTRAEAAAKRSAWIWKQVSPAIAVNNYHWERGMNALAQAAGGELKWVPDFLGGDATGIGRDGNPVQAKYAAMQTFGIKARPIDLETSEQIDNNLRNKMIRDIDAEIKKLQRLNAKGAIADRVLESEWEKAQVKKERLREGLTVDGDEKP